MLAIIRVLLFCTIHKCASVYVGQLLAKLAISHSITPIDLDRFVTSSSSLSNSTALQKARVFRRMLQNSNRGEENDLKTFTRSFFKTGGCFYGPFRSGKFVNTLPAGVKPKILLMLRDPRDAQTSRYFSRAYSHAAPQDQDQQQDFFAKRTKALSVTIDEFVLKTAPSILRGYQFYIDDLLSQGNVEWVKYEEMVTDFPSWLDRVINFWGLELAPETRDYLLRSADFEVPEEDIHSHKRQVSPGDHLRKLQPETIKALNEIFHDVLMALDYAPQNESISTAA
ncbi:MAG: sulfotransferase domain-containing protein [Pirellulales bacterium]